MELVRNKGRRESHTSKSDILLLSSKMDMMNRFFFTVKDATQGRNTGKKQSTGPKEGKKRVGRRS